MNKSNQKFANFYSSVKQFIIDTELSKPENLIGSDILTIEKLENELGIKLPDFLFSFFKYFGEKIEILMSEELLNLTINDFRKAYLMSKEASIIEILKDEKGLIDTEDEELIWHMSDILDVNHILIIYQHPRWQNYVFVDATVENPIPYFLHDEEYFESGRIAFTNYIRDVLFSIIQYRFKDVDYSIYNKDDPNDQRILESQKRILSINIEKIKWVEFYTNLTVNKDYFFYRDWQFKDLRKEFYTIISKKEAENDTILTIDEFELAFIDFLKERDFKAPE